MEKTYNSYKEHLQKISHLNSAIALLGWDQEVYMPKSGAGVRAQQFSTLATISHELSTNPDFEATVIHLLEKSSFGFKEKRNLEESKYEIEESKKLNSDFIKRSAVARSSAFQSWQEARQKEDFSIFQSDLQVIVDLEKEKANLLGYKGHPYNALLNLYERDLTVKTLEQVFDQVKTKIVPLVKAIKAKEQSSDACIKQSFSKEDQWKFSLEILKQMEFDTDGGRQDLSTHPFTSSFNSKDVRLTTRVDENDLSEIIWSTVHEGGHGLYEQGLKIENYGLPSGEFVSLGIHESQSRIWENNIGRALPWWEHMYPILQAQFPDQLKDVALIDFYKAMNKVEASLVRTSADELTYHIHVMIRYEIEKGLIEGSIEVKDLEEVWNEKYLNYLGVSASKPTEGVLQDIHWSHGSLGYFPTYSIGSFYAAQFYATAKKKIPKLEMQLKKGNVSAFLKLMRTHIHQHGKIYSAAQLCENFTGERLNINHFVKYAKEKYADIYGI
jgi:carboxypeptidase Taq